MTRTLQAKPTLNATRNMHCNLLIKSSNTAFHGSSQHEARRVFSITTAL